MWSQPSNNKQQPTTREATVNNQQQQQLQFRFECVCVRKERKKKGGKQQGKLVIGVVVGLNALVLALGPTEDSSK